jgi:hypothetical protein
MWMQILAAAGLPVIGEEFPGDWHETLRDANRYGFHESLLRHGIYYRTNPHPVTGEHIRAGDVRGHAVKVFLPGLVRTDAAHLDRVLVTVRPWREYEASLRRLHAIDDQRLRSDAARARAARRRMPPALEWWDEHVTFLRDLSLRGYACHVQSYDGVLDDPRGVLARTFAWLGIDADLEAAIATVRPYARTQRAPASESVPPHVAEVFDAFYEAVHRGEGLGPTLIARINATHQTLEPEITRHRREIALDRGFLPSRALSLDLPFEAPDDPDDDPDDEPADGPFVVLPGEWA